jgi:hypothetical protein
MRETDLLVYTVFVAVITCLFHLEDTESKVLRNVGNTAEISVV